MSITTADIRAYVAKRKTDVITTGSGETEKTRPVSNAEINNELKVLARMFSLAVESGKLAYKPKVPMLKENNARTGFFEPEQFESVRKHLPEHLRPLVTFMYVTGWRRSEVTGLQWRQIDFQGREVRLIQARRRTMRVERFRSRWSCVSYWKHSTRSTRS